MQDIDFVGGTSSAVFDSGIFIDANNSGAIAWNDVSSDISLDVDGESVNLSEFIKSVKESLGQSPVLLKCSHCGQWGAKYCSCRYCGAPVG